MKIGIEAQRIFRRNKHGMDIVAVQLIRHLQQIDTKNEYYIFVKDDEDQSTIQETSNFKIVLLKKGAYPYWEQVILPKAISKYNLDLLHCTNNTAPLNTNIPLVITLHDIIYLEKLNFTEGTSYQIFGNWYRRWNVPRILQKSKMIITVSEYERNRILNYFNLNNDRVCTIYNAIDENFKRITNSQTLSSVKTRYQLPEEFVLYLGNTDPKKNMMGVMKALSILRKKNQLNFYLVMIDIDRSNLEKIASRIDDYEILNNIIVAPYIPNHELPSLYSLAKIFLYPSLRESFGIPILESMACETPVITSNTSSMPEVAGDAAYFVNPYSPEDIASGITRVLNDEALQKTLIAKGLQRYPFFSWRDNALKTLSLYQSILSVKTSVPKKEYA